MKRNPQKRSKSIILIAEDDKAIAEVMTIILQEAGFIVQTVRTYEAVNAMLRRGSVDLVLLDLWLSGENGSEICLAIKKADPTQSLPVIIISAHDNLESIAQSVSADDFLQKPFDIDVLLKKVKKYLPVRHIT